MKRKLLLLFLLLAAHAAAQTSPQVIALTHATLIDGSGAAPRRNVTIVMADGRAG